VSGNNGASQGSHPLPAVSDVSKRAEDDLPLGSEADPNELREVRFVDLVRARQTSPLPLPRTGAPNLPLGELDPEVLERLAAEMIKRRPNLGAHFYGRRGQKQHGLDIVEREAMGSNSVYQVRRYDALTPDKISSAVMEYADPPPPKKGGEKPARRFGARRYVLFTAAEFETDKALQDRLQTLQAHYAGDLIIEVWGREMISSMLRDSGALVNSVFGPDWARSFCGFAPPPADPADPDRLGLVENPIQVLNLDAFASDAAAAENDHPLDSARLYGMLADTLDEANFPGHAARQRTRQAQLLQVGGNGAEAFALFWRLALDHFRSGATTKFGTVHHDLEQLRPSLDGLQTAKLDVLTAVQEWYERGSQLAVAVPALEVIAAATDPDAPFLACVTLEQVLVDNWFDFNPPWSLVDPGGNTADLLSRLRRCADGLSCADVLIRARLACALADTDLTADSTAADINIAFEAVLQQAGAGRYLHVGGLVFARAAHAFAMHGDTARAIDLWRQSILLSSESRLYGDVLAVRQALNAAILEQPVIAFSELDYASSLPNAKRLLAAAQPAELNALWMAHAGKLPDAFGVTRRYLWEARLSGQLSDERDAMELFGDIMRAANHPEVAVTAWVMAGAAKKAADLAGQFAAPEEMDPWARSPVRVRQAAAAQVIGAQARLYEPAAAEKVVHLLLGLTGGLWTSLRIQPHPPLDAVNALSRFGGNLPASAVDPVLELLEPCLTAGGVLSPETVNLLIQLYWAVPSRRDDLAAVIGPQLALDNPPPHLGGMVANLPEQARGPVTPAVSALADAGNLEALLTLAKWRQPTAAVQLAARRTCAHLLRQPTGKPANTWSLTTQFSDAAALLLALTDADPLTDVDPQELRPGTGPVLTGGTLFVRITAPASPSPPDTGPVPGHPVAEGAAADEGSAWKPDPRALVAAGPPLVLAAAVAEHLLAVAEGHQAPAFVRAEALSALYSILRQLPPDVNSRLAGRLLAIAENPALNEDDQAELASQDPLSRGRLDIGARRLPMLALLTAASAAASAAEAGTDIESLPAQAVQRLITHAMRLLRNPDREASTYGATVLALVSRYEPGLARYTAALVGHPSDEVRSIAAATAALDETTQHMLVADSSPQVRARLAGRTRELADDVLATLRTDEHVDVIRALASAAKADDGKSTKPA
jgi:hypothetical protein